jgi:hypothetical protein
MISMTKTYLLLTVHLLAALALSQPERVGIISASSVNATTTNYYFARPNEMTIVVTVMGEVQKPGRYEISKSIDLINLLGLAGGANSEGTLGDITVSRLTEQGGLINRHEIHINLGSLAGVSGADLVVLPGDIIYVGHSTWATLRDIFIVAGSAALITTAVTQVILVTRK